MLDTRYLIPDTLKPTRHVQLELMKRKGTFDVVAVEDSIPNLLDQIPLEYLDFVVDPKTQKLLANPEHRGRMMTEEF